MKRPIKRLVRKVFVAANLDFVYNWMSRVKTYVVLPFDRWIVRHNYARIVLRIRKYPKSRTIRVAFLVTETAKWKAQSLYEAMKHSDDFEPFMVITASVYDVKFYADGLKDKLGKDRSFYEGLGCQCVMNFDVISGRPHPLSDYSPDFVFYQEPRLFFQEDSVRETAKKALCCDIPYAIRTLGGGTDLQDDPDYHQLMFLQFPPTEAQSHFYRAALPEWRWAGTSRAIGHPILDQYLKPPKVTELTGCVIYAPHFSFPLPGLKRSVTLSSFLENGRKILEYAQRHPEFPWLFKPHPRLYKELILTGVWTREEVENYYMAWGRLGRVCTDGDYIHLFQNARVLITDCGSFLVEFPMTGKPLIRLVPQELNYPLFPIYEELYESFYVVRNLDEMYKAFALVLERGEDPKREERLKAVKTLGLMGEKTSAERIMDVLREVCGRN